MAKTPRYGTSRDANEPEIVEALRAVGASVLLIDDIDLIVGFRGVNYLLEVKTATGKLNKKQEKFFRGWVGQVNIVRTVDQALALIGAVSAQFIVMDR